jgi:hypothetical protein
MLAFGLLQDKINGGFCGYGDELSVFIAVENFIIRINTYSSRNMSYHVSIVVC